MAVFAVMALLALTQVSSSLANEAPSTNQTQTLGIAIQEMQKANYFGFVMLMNMVPYAKLPSNVTFLMPNNRVLAKAIILENDVVNFLLRHSIPSPLRFENLNHIPTGSIIPSSEPDFMFRILNNGRRSFFLNNVKLVSPDLCVSGSSVRCHGIDGVLVGLDIKAPPLPPNNTPPMTAPSLPPPGPPLADETPATDSSYGFAPAATPQPAVQGPTPRRSGSSHLTVNNWLTIVGLFGVIVMLPMVHN